MSARARQLPVYDSAKFRLPLLFETRELLRYRFLVRNLISRDLKVRYKRSTIGFVWVMLNPLLTMIVMAVVFSQILGIRVEHYAVYLLSGLLLWNVYAQGTTAAMSGLVGNGQVLRKLYVPPSAFVVSAIGSALVNFLYALVPLALVAAANQIWPQVPWAMLLVPTLLVTMFSLGIGLMVSALYVFFRDTFEIYQVLLQAYYFLTPLMYKASQLPEPLRSAEQFNPMALYLDMFRNAMMSGTLPSVQELGWAVGMAVVVLVAGWTVFTRVEEKFAYHF
jgi:ABC-type polysaccharide/polyol phosphate export permease